MSFGEVLRTLLEERDISQKQFAEDLNMGASTIGNYIRDVREPDIETIKRIASYFHISLDLLLDYSPNPISDKNVRDCIKILSALSPSDRQLWLEQGNLLIRFRDKKK